MFPFVGFVKKCGLVLEAPLPETKRRNKNRKKKLGVGRHIFLWGIYSFLAKGKLQMSLEVHFAQETKIKGQSKVGRDLLWWEFY